MKRVPMQSISVIRDGKSECPPIGVAFDFTKEEVEQIGKMNPDALGVEAVVDVTKAQAESPKKAESTKKEDL